MTEPSTRRPLQSVSEIRRFFRTATTPVRGAAEYRWPSFAWPQSFARFETGTRTVSLVETSAA